MREAFTRIKDKLFNVTSRSYGYPEEYGEDYLEIDAKKDIGNKTKVLIKPFVLEEFTDVKPILDSLRDGYTIALVNIRPLKDKDIVELKRAVNKIKKTCDAIEGDIAGFGEDWIVVAPSFAEVYRTRDAEELQQE